MFGCVQAALLQLGIEGFGVFTQLQEALELLVGAGFVPSGQQGAGMVIRPIDFDNPSDVAQHDKMVLLVERMLDLNKQKAAETNPNTLKQLDTQITATDRQIDRLVYELYDLTEEKIALVEQSA